MSAMLRRTGLVALCILAASCARREDPLTAMRTAAARAPRPFAGRLSGFAWSQRGIVAEDNWRLKGTASDVIESSEKTPNAETLHHAGAAHLLIGDTEAGIAALERSAQMQPSNARVWSDLAAAVEAANAPERLTRALAYADKAIELDPNLAEAHFNRAVILHRIGLLTPANHAADAYRKIDSQSQWATETRRFAMPPRPLAPAQFGDALQCALADACCANNRIPLQQLVRRQPRDARGWAESPLLAEWGTAVLARDELAAKQRLEDVRAVAQTLVAHNGEHLAFDAVTSIGRASDEQRRILAAASVEYTSGREARFAQDRTAARLALRSAAQKFAEGGSPMSLTARYYASTSLSIEQFGRTMAELQQLAGMVDRTRHPALAASIDWDLGLAESQSGKWSLALEHLERSRATFKRLDEILFAAFVGEIIAECNDALGDPESAWRRRIDTFADLSRVDTFRRLTIAASGAIRMELARKENEGAAALARAIASEAAGGDGRTAAAAFANEAHVLLVTDGPHAALQAIVLARRAGDTLEDPAVRTETHAKIDIIEAAILRALNPRRAVDLLERPIQCFSRGTTALLAAAYVERGRAQVVLKNFEAARADFDRALRLRELERKAAPDPTVLFDRSSDAIAELIDLDLHAGHPERAFATIERVRGRTIVERLGIRTSLETIKTALPPRTVVVEYAVLPRSLVAFTLDTSGLAATPIPISESDLKSLTAKWVDAIRTGKPVTAALFDHLIRPIAPRLIGAQTIVFVPDRFLFTIPFAALYDPSKRRYLIEDYRVVTSPNAALLSRLRGDTLPGPGFVVGDPTTTDGALGLTFARLEAEAVAAIHGVDAPLIGEAATAERFVVDAPRHGWIHYAGHAHSTTRDSWLSLAGDGLSAGEISELPLRQTRLVVLAACGTLAGRTDRIEGTPSLGQAFLAAGAQTVIGTLWDVEDRRTSRFFRLLHQRIRSGLSPSVALQNVQVALLRDPDPSWRDPAAWAAVQQFGLD